MNNTETLYPVKNGKKNILIIFAIIIIIFGIILSVIIINTEKSKEDGETNTNNGNNVETKSNIIDKSLYDTALIFSSDENGNYFQTHIYNKSDKKFYIKSIVIRIFYKDGNLLKSETKEINNYLNPGKFQLLFTNTSVTSGEDYYADIIIYNE